jgi:hypothetical protein
VLQELESISYATALDLYMGYYTIRLDTDASRICTINFPWVKYSYKRLPMGIAGSPNHIPSGDVGANEKLGICPYLLRRLINNNQVKP